MEVVKQDFLENLKQIVEVRAKYQKVMLLYDNSASNGQIASIIDAIKGVCIYNKMNTDVLDYNEINNGYKLIIYLMSADSFLHLDIELTDFINIFLPTTDFVLPFYSNNFKLNKLGDYLFLMSNNIDISIETSIMFNKLYDYINGLIVGQIKDDEMFKLSNITQSEILKLLNASEINFVDLKILKQCNISVEFLPVVDLVLISAIKTLVYAIYKNNLGLVDCYKATQNDEALIDKFYAQSTNNTLIELIKLNSVNLNNLIFQIDETLKNLNWFFSSIKRADVDKIILKVKDYLKQSNDFLFNLYLYNIFGV